MSLVTRCPRCRTLYRVLPAQLQARAGKVRCGRCMYVFDGFQALAVEQANAVSEPVRFEPEAPLSNGQAMAPAPASTPADTHTAAMAAAEEPAIADESASDAQAQPPQPDSRLMRGVRELFATQSDAVPAGERLLRKPTGAQLWAAGSVVLAVALGLQIAFAYRSELSARFPVMSPVMTAVCEAAGCSVPLPQRPDLVRIEASDVHMIDANRPALIQLTATLRSYASYNLAYPALDLVLTNANEHALARRIFTPDEYLDHVRDPKAGIAPNAEITVALDLDTGDLNAAGFRLDLLAAPPP